MLLHRAEITPLRRQTKSSAIAKLTLVGAVATAAWPRRPGGGVLNESIPLFFISRDGDGFWIAREAESRIGGIFLSKRSAMRFAQRCSGPTRCATMMLEETHTLDIENRGNRLVGPLRPARRLLTRLASKLKAVTETAIGRAHALGARWSRAYFEHRLLKAALEVELYRGRYKHSNKNDDDLPLVTEMRMLKHVGKDRAAAGEKTDIVRLVFGLVVFALILIGMATLDVAVWVPKLHY